DAALRVCAEGPVGDVEVVDVLLADVVAREPREVEPVAELPLHVRPGGLAGLHPKAPLVPENTGGADLADRAVMDARHRLEIALLVAPLGASDDRELLFLGLLGRLEHLTDAGPVDAHRFLGEEMLARFNRGGDV